MVAIVVHSYQNSPWLLSKIVDTFNDVEHIFKYVNEAYSNPKTERTPHFHKQTVIVRKSRFMSSLNKKVFSCRN